MSRLLDALHGAGDPLPPFAADIDRTGVVAGRDVVRLVDLMNGAETYVPWLGRFLP
jgi:hypothetical protein